MQLYFNIYFVAILHSRTVSEKVVEELKFMKILDNLTDLELNAFGTLTKPRTSTVQRSKFQGECKTHLFFLHLSYIYTIVS